MIIKNIERVQQLFRVNKLNAWHIATFVYDEHYQDWIVTFTQNYYSRCRSDREHLITRQSWKLRITNAEITYDDKNTQMIHVGYPWHYHVITPTDFVNSLQELHIYRHGLMKKFVSYSDCRNSLEE